MSKRKLFDLEDLPVTAADMFADETPAEEPAPEVDLSKFGQPINFTRRLLVGWLESAGGWKPGMSSAIRLSSKIVQLGRERQSVNTVLVGLSRPGILYVSPELSSQAASLGGVQVGEDGDFVAFLFS